MKLKIHFKLALLAIAIPIITFANTELPSLKTSKQRNIKKSYNVNPNATLKVTNSFGHLNIITWDQNTIEFDITIKITGNDEEKIQERLSKIDIDFSATKDFVSALTKIEKNEKNWWNWGEKMNLKMEIDYVIKMPISNNVDLKNQFGTITLDQLKGSSKISCNHGKIITKELMSNSNNISFNHAQDNFFEYINNGKINTNHSSFTVAKTKSITINANHSKSDIEIAEVVNYNCNFGSLKVDNVNSFVGKGNHLNLRIGNLYKMLKISGNHGNLKILKIEKNASEIDINTKFTSMTIGYDEGFNFNFDLNFAFGSLRESSGFNFISKDVKHTSKKYEGYYGTKDSGNTLKIDSQHGSVSFKKQ